MDNTQINNNYEKEDNDIDLAKIFNILKRNKKIIFVFILGATIISSYRSFKTTPIWSGSFNIVVKNQSPSESRSFSNSSGFNPIFNLSKVKDGNETQRLILKSPLVLTPVFNFVKNNYEGKGLNTDKFYFNNWVGSALNIEFEAGSSVLKVEYFSPDKELIIKALKLISTKYQSYSKQDTEKQITKSITYLEEQKKLMKKRSLLSTKELNEFSINNGLGNIDGFVGLGNSTSVSSGIRLSGTNFLDPKTNSQVKLSSDFQNNSSNSSSAGIRFQNQFKLLQKYEANFVDLSAKLKPNSKTLTILSSKIDNLRESLKRPNEILIKYKELQIVAARNEQLLNDIESSLEVLKINRIKTPEPWELISEPTLDTKPVNKNTILFFMIPISFAVFLSSLISIIKENLSGKIFELDEYKNLIRYKYLDSLFKNNATLNENIINNSLDLPAKEKVALVNLGDGFLKDEFQGEIKIVDSKDRFKLITLKNIKELDDYKNILLIAMSGEVSKLNLSFIDKYLLPYKKKISGWFFLP